MKERYSKYKSSGVEWIGEIPIHWELKRLGFGVDTIVPMRDKPEDLTGDIPWIRIEDYVGKYISKSKSSQGVSLETIKEMNLKVYPIGTVLTTCSCSFGTSMIVKEPIVSNQTFIGLVPKNDLLFNEYLYYVLQVWKEELEIQSSGSIQLYLSRDNFKSLRVLYPPLYEQKQIVEYIDEKTSQIDSLIAITEKKIELLKQKRASLINEAVTKGLNKDVELKDSGVEWIGEIPKHWVVCKLKYICNLITDGSHFSPEIEHEGRYYISVSDITKNQQIDFLNSKKINDKSFEELERNGCRPMTGDILLTKDGTIGRGTIVGDFNDFVILSSLGLIRLNPKQYNQFILQYLLSDLNVEQMYSHIRGSGITRLTIKLINDLLIIVPPLTEQEQIVKYIDTHTSEIDKLVSIEQRRIETLKEYRQSLISEVVTGKIRVYEDISEPQAS
jgi:type I restriction enzyme, S subunit